VLQSLSDRSGGAELQTPTLPQQHDAERMVELRIRHHNAFHRNVADPPRLMGRELGHLPMHVGRGIEEEPPLAVGANRGRGLGPRESSAGVRARDAAGRAPAVPLGESASCRRT
jgi:hypothetical protein